MPYIVTTNYSVLMIYNVTALSRPYDLYYNSTHYVFLLHLLQQLLCLHDLSCYRSYDVFRTYMVTATTTPYDLHCYSNYYTFTLHRYSTYYVLMIYCYNHYYLFMNYINSSNHLIFTHYDIMSYIIPATKPPSRPIVLQPICYILTI